MYLKTYKTRTNLYDSQIQYWANFSNAIFFFYNGYMHLVSPYWYVRVCTGIFANLLFANLFRNSLNVHKNTLFQHYLF
jgi:hypothetical protein